MTRSIPGCRTRPSRSRVGSVRLDDASDLEVEEVSDDIVIDEASPEEQELDAFIEGKKRPSHLDGLRTTLEDCRRPRSARRIQRMKRAWLRGGGDRLWFDAPSKLPPPPSPVVVEPAFDPPQPALRLPRHFLPTRYIARLAIDPAQPTFDGEISIEGALDRRAAVIWLHGEHLDIASAKASDGTRDVTLAATVHGDLLELRAAHAARRGRAGR